MTDSDELLALKESLLRIINKFGQLEKIPIDYGTGDLLHASEINTLEIIGRAPGINVTELAKRKGVTKGAVSQVVKKLEHKVFVKRLKDRKNDKAVPLVLTPKGNVAFVGHERFHARYDRDILARLQEMTPEQAVFLQETFDLLEEAVDSYLAELR